MKRSVFAMLTAAATMIGILAAAHAAVPRLANGAQAGKKITVCLLPKKKGVPYFTTCAKGAA